MEPKSGQNPMCPPLAWCRGLALARQSPRCGARTRLGGACQQPGMVNHRCRLHGGASTGPRTAEGLERIRIARTIHGRYSAENRHMAALVRALKARAKRLVELA